MKKSIAFLLLFVFSINMVFATSEPIPRIDIIVKKKPGHIAVANFKTDATGKFSTKLSEKGKYDITYSFDDIKKAIIAKDKAYEANPAAYAITVTVSGDTPGIPIFDRWGNLYKNSTIEIIKESAISVGVSAGTTVTCTFTYALKSAHK